MADNEARITLARLFVEGVCRDKLMSLADAEERFLIGGRKPKWRRMLRALWRVKDA